MRSIRDIFQFYFVDWHRRVDASWCGEMASGTFATLLVLLYVTTRKEPIREEYIPWLIGLSFLAAAQLAGAAIGNRRLRGFASFAALASWVALSFLVWDRAGFIVFHAGPLTMAIVSFANCAAYYVSSKPSTQLSTTQHG